MIKAQLIAEIKAKSAEITRFVDLSRIQWRPSLQFDNLETHTVEDLKTGLTWLSKLYQLEVQEVKQLWKWMDDTYWVRVLGKPEIYGDIHGIKKMRHALVALGRAFVDKKSRPFVFSIPKPPKTKTPPAL